MLHLLYTVEYSLYSTLITLIEISDWSGLPSVLDIVGLCTVIISLIVLRLRFKMMAELTQQLSQYHYLSCTSGQPQIPSFKSEL